MAILIPEKWFFKDFCGTNPVSSVKLRWHQRGFANATPDMLCAQCQRTICTKLPWAALETAAKPQFETGWRSRYGGAKDLRSLLRSASGASLIRIGVSTKIFEDPKNWGTSKMSKIFWHFSLVVHGAATSYGPRRSNTERACFLAYKFEGLKV